MGQAAAALQAAGGHRNAARPCQRHRRHSCRPRERALSCAAATRAGTSACSAATSALSCGAVWRLCAAGW